MPAQISALDEEPALESLLAVGIEVAAFSSSDARPGQSSTAAQCAQQQVHFEGTSEHSTPTLTFRGMLPHILL